MDIAIVVWGWALAAVGLTGFLLGCFFRAPTVAAASIIFAPACVALGVVSGLSSVTTVIATACGLLALQASYLVGFLLVGWASGSSARGQSAAHQTRLPRSRSA